MQELVEMTHGQPLPAKRAPGATAARRAPADRKRLGAAAFIKANLPLHAVPAVPEIVIHTASPASGLWRLARRGATTRPPYWAYPWAGGAALARHFLDRPETVRGRSVLDLGAGSGLVAIAAVKSGAGRAIAADIDPDAIAALPLNAGANGVALEIVADDLLEGEPPRVDAIAVGDLFYESALAERATIFLDRCLAAGLDIFVGDIGRAYLPRPRLRLVAEYLVRDFGDGAKAPLKPAGVYAFQPP